MFPSFAVPPIPSSQAFLGSPGAFLVKPVPSAVAGPQVPGADNSSHPCLGDRARQGWLRVVPESIYSSTVHVHTHLGEMQGAGPVPCGFRVR